MQRNKARPKDESKKHPTHRHAPLPNERDQDSDPPRTAVPPDVSDEEKDWGRLEGC